jgi:predicted transglutaminase-like cysteine proteinase
MAALAVFCFALSGDAALARRKGTPPEPSPAHSLPQDLFGAREIAHPPALDFAKWTDTIARYEKERGEEKALCDAGDCALVRWREFLATLGRNDAMTQLRAVNEHLNRLPYRTDFDNYGAEDYWAAPREFFAKGGDCEDYAIAKYLSLRALGWPAERLRVVVVHDNARDLVHAALVAYHGGSAYLLDIEISQVTDHRSVARYAPIFAISETGWWSYPSLPPSEAAVAVAKVVGTVGTKLAEQRSLTMRHKPGYAATRVAREHAAPVPRLLARHASFSAARRSPHMKHESARGGAAAPRPVADVSAAAGEAERGTVPAERVKKNAVAGTR